MKFQFTLEKTLKSLFGLGLALLFTFGGIFVYKTNFDKYKAQTKIQTEDSTHHLKLARFDVRIHTLVPYFKDTVSQRLVIKDCEEVEIKVFVENDSVAITDYTHRKPLLNGRAIQLIQNKATIVGISTDFMDKQPVFFTLTRMTPPHVDGNVASNLSLILHIGPKDQPFFILSQKSTCAELKEYLRIN